LSLSTLAQALSARLGAVTSTWSYELTRPGVRAYARAMGYRARHYYWLEDALALGFTDLPAPFGYLGAPVYLPGFIDERFSEPGDPADLSFAGYAVLDAGTMHSVLRTPCAGESLHLRSSLERAELVQTAGGPGLRVERALRFEDAQGQLALFQRRRTVYR
jgi:hypothetical protein